MGALWHEVVGSVYVLLAIRCAVGLLLLVGGIGKLANLPRYRRIVSAYDILPKAGVRVFSYGLPIAEALSGLLLLAGVLSPVPQTIAACLFLVFATAIATNLLRGRLDLPCGCLGATGSTISWSLVARDISLCGLSLSTARSFGSIGAALAVAGLIGVLVCWTAGRGRASAQQRVVGVPQR